MNDESSHNKFIGPALSTGLLLAPMKNYETLEATGAVRIIDHHSSQFAIEFEQGNPEAGILFIDGGVNKEGIETKIYLGKQGLELEKHAGAIIITHLHFDHTGVLNVLPSTVRTIIGAGDVDVLQGTRKSEGPLPWTIDMSRGLIKRPPMAAVKRVIPELASHMQEFRFGELSVRIFEVPGHTRGSIVASVRRGDEDQPTDLFPGDAFDITRWGRIRYAPGIFTGDKARSKQSVADLADIMAELGVVEGQIGPAHSGIGEFKVLHDSRLNKRRKKVIASDA